MTLSGSKATHTIENKQSDKITRSRPNYFGVPQGLILGPVFNNIFVIDMRDNINYFFLVEYAGNAQFLPNNTVNVINILVKKKKNDETLHKARSYFLRNGLIMMTALSNSP